MTELATMLKRLHLPTTRRQWRDMESRAEADRMRYPDYLQTLCLEEIANRARVRVTQMTRRARFPFIRTIEEFDFTHKPSVRNELLGSSLAPELVHERRNLFIDAPAA